MNMRYKLVTVLLILSLTAMMFFPISSNAVQSSDGDSLNPASQTNPLDGIAPAGVNDPYIDTIPVVEDSIVVDTAPNFNYNGDGLWVGLHSVGYYGRGWLKFDLPVASSSYEITRARMFVYLENDNYLVDAPIGAYYSSDDSWDETTITWNSQPSYDIMPLDLIDSPASPNMFVKWNYYSWDVTSAASESILDDSVLSVMLKQENESLTNQTSKYFSEKDSFNAHPAYLELEWHVPPVSSSFNGTIPVTEDAPIIDTAPNFNYNGDGLWIGLHAVGYYGRGWLKFNLSDVPNSLQITSARMFVYLENDQYLVDAPIGAYYGSSDSWDETTITWNNQPSYDIMPLDLIDNPASPNMFVKWNYYSWDVTSAASESLLDDDVLSVMLKQENESLTNQTSKYFSEKDSFNAHPAYLQFEWQEGVLQNATLDVIEDAPVIDVTPNTNYNDDGGLGGMYVGRHTSGYYSRGWFKFNLSVVPSSFALSSARMFVYLINEYADDVDAPIGAYYSKDNSWSETGITWNNQPSTDFIPVDLIDSPASPDMFVDFNYYSWDITSAATTAMMDDGILSIVLQQENESIDYNTFKYFVEREYDGNFSAYIQLEWQTPSTSTPTVEGYSRAPYVDYISNPTPEFGWDFIDHDIDESQTNYEVELYDEGANKIWNNNRSNFASVFDLGTDLNARPFSSPSEMKFQFKYPSSLIPNSGLLDKLYFDINLDTAVLSYSNFTLLMLNMDNDTALSSDFTANYDGGTPTTTFFSTEYYPEIRNGQLIIDSWNTFFVNKDMDLLIEIKYTSATGPIITSNNSVASTGSVAYTYSSSAYNNGTADYTYDRTHNLYLDYATDIVRDDGPATHVYPFNATSPLTIQMKYNKSLLEHSGFIDRLYFRVENMSGSLTLHNFTLSLVESTLEGPLGYNFIDNYQGATPIVVINESSYEISYENYWLVIDIPDKFFYSGLNDLLIEIRYSAVTGAATLSHLISSTGMENGGSRAYGYSISSDWAVITDYNVYDLAVDIVNPESSITYDGPSLVYGTAYTLSVRTRDTLGIWSPWSEVNFTYNAIGFEPTWTNLFTTGDIIALSTSTTIQIDVQHPEGIDEVLFSGAGVNYTMTNTSNTYSYTWTPPSYGANPFTIYMKSTLGYWNTTNNIITTIDGHAPVFNSIDRNPLTPSDVESVTITANVSDQFGVSKVILYYNDGLQTLNMTMNLSGPLYEGTIPALSRDSTVTYQIVANDTSDNTVYSSVYDYTVQQSAPEWSDLTESSGTIELGENVTFSINASHSVGMSLVQLGISGTNYTMLNSSGIYTWTWTPDTIGSANYVVYMLSTNGYWNTTSSSIDVIDTTDPIVVSVSINPLSPTDAASVTVTANLSDLGGFEEVLLQYDSGSGWTNISMIESGTIFTGEIPALPEGTIVTYRIYVVDPSGNWVLSAEDSYTVSGSSTTTTTTTTTTTPPTTPATTTNTTTPSDFIDIMIIIVIASVGLVAVIAIIGLSSSRKKS